MKPLCLVPGTNKALLQLFPQSFLFLKGEILRLKQFVMSVFVIRILFHFLEFDLVDIQFCGQSLELLLKPNI